jgi:predicted secreted Zn-dependent protease
MYETKDTDWRRPFNPDRPTGNELTLGAVAKLSDAAAEARAAFAKFAADIAKHADDLAAIAKRLARLEKQSADDAAPRAIIR